MEGEGIDFGDSPAPGLGLDVTDLKGEGGRCWPMNRVLSNLSDHKMPRIACAGRSKAGNRFRPFSITFATVPSGGG